jgi:hypothetical protein
MSSYKPTEYVEESERWREHAAAQDWWRIDDRNLSGDERSELLQMLTKVVPIREWGEGLKKFKDFIHPSDATTMQLQHAAILARKLKKREESEARGSVNAMLRPFMDPFVEAVQLGKETLRKYRIEYEGMSRTYLYWRPHRRDWINLRRSRAKLIIDRSERLNPFDRDTFHTNGYDQLSKEDLTEKYLEWENWKRRYSWRDCRTLGYLYENEFINPYSHLWYACNILRAYERTFHSEECRLSGSPLSLSSKLSSTAKYSVAHMCDAYTAAFSIGTAHEALKNKTLEPDAIRGIDQLKSASEGGKERGRRYEAEQRKLVSDIQQRLYDGKSVSAALRMVAAKNLKARVFNQSNQTHQKEFSRIRGVWYRHSKKL